MKRRKRIVAQLPLLLLWLILSALIWSEVFIFITDTTPDRKITLFTGPDCRSTALSAALEEALPEGLRMVQAHPFSYAMLDGEQLRTADLYIAGVSQISDYQEWFSPLPEAFADSDDLWLIDGVPFGLRVYTAANGCGAAGTLIDYSAPDGTSEDHYLFFGAHSLHNPICADAVDDAASAIAKYFMTLP